MKGAVPVARTFIGVEAGLVAGVIMEVPWWPDITGDDDCDSIADAAGHYTGQAWEQARNDGWDTVKDAGRSFGDGANDLAESASESDLNPLNWWD